MTNQSKASSLGSRIDGLFDLIGRKIPDHHLKDKCLVDYKKSLTDGIEAEIRLAIIDEINSILKNIKDKNVDGDDEGAAYYWYMQDRIAQLSDTTKGKQ